MRKATGTRSRGPRRKKSARTKSVARSTPIARAKKASSRAEQAQCAVAERMAELRKQTIPMCMNCRVHKRWAESTSNCGMCALREIAMALLGAVHSQSRGFAPEEIAPERTASIDTYTDPAHVRAMQRLVARAEQVFGEGTADAAAKAFTGDAR